MIMVMKNGIIPFTILPNGNPVTPTAVKILTATGGEQHPMHNATVDSTPKWIGSTPSV